MNMHHRKNATTRRGARLAIVLFTLLSAGIIASAGTPTTTDSDQEAVVTPNPSLKIAGFRGTVHAANRKMRDGQRVPKGSEYYNSAERPGTNLLARPSAFTTFGETIPDNLDAEQVIEAARLQWQCEKVTSESLTGRTIPIYDADGNLIETYRHEVDPETGTTALVPFVVPEYAPNLNHMGKEYTITRRSDTQEPLGSVGQDFAVRQHEDVIRDVHEMSGQTHMDWEYVGVVENGAKMFGCVLLDQNLSQSYLANSPDERFNTYLVVTNAHDGTGSLRYSWVTLRGACWNAFSSAIQAVGNGTSVRAGGTEVVIRHNSNLEANVDLLTSSIHGMEEMNRSFLNYAEMMKAWEMTEAEMHDFWVNMLASHGGLSQDPNRVEDDGTNRWGLSTKGLNILTTLMDIREMEQNNVDGMHGTVWQGVQVLLDYEDHEKLYDNSGNMKQKTLANALHGSGMRAKNSYLTAGIQIVREDTDAGLLTVQHTRPIDRRENGTGLHLGPKVATYNDYLQDRAFAGNPVLLADGTPAQPVVKNGGKHPSMKTITLD